MVTNGTMQPTCIRHFMASMGFPCAQKMMNWKEWPIIQKEDAQERVSQLVNPSPLLLFEPNVLCHRGHPSGTKKGKNLAPQDGMLQNLSLWKQQGSVALVKKLSNICGPFEDYIF
ncbi:hypothetical protein ACSBR2_039444 [Camellia fascicularis]